LNKTLIAIQYIYIDLNHIFDLLTDA
jgi:hypothetical protein